MITGGVVAHPLARAFDVLRFFLDHCASLPDEAMLLPGLQAAIDGSNPGIGLVAGHCGPLAQGEAALRPSCVRSSRDGAMGPSTPRSTGCSIRLPEGRELLEAQFLTDLSDGRFGRSSQGFQECPSPMSNVVIEHFHGAASRIPVRPRRARCACRVQRGHRPRSGRIRETERGIKWARRRFSLAP
jgi:hypothetical protein